MTRRREPERFGCVQCRVLGVAVDEDGCCVTCGADALVVYGGRKRAANTWEQTLDAVDRAVNDERTALAKLRCRLVKFGRDLYRDPETRGYADDLDRILEEYATTDAGTSPMGEGQ